MTLPYCAPKKMLPPFFEVPGGPRVPDGRSLGDAPAAAAGGDDDLGRLVLVLDEMGHDVVEELDPEGPVAVGRVGEALPR